LAGSVVVAGTGYIEAEIGIKPVSAMYEAMQAPTGTRGSSSERTSEKLGLGVHDIVAAPTSATGTDESWIPPLR